MKNSQQQRRIKIAAVSYLNTVPFIFGLDNSTVDFAFDLRLGYPSKCAKMLLEDEVDLALLPIGALSEFEKLNIITPFCISSYGPVASVILVSNCPVESIKRIYLDIQSRTSNMLVQVLCREFWKISPVFVKPDDFVPKTLRKCDAMIAIGDKTFRMKQEFKYCYDLGEIWKKMTSLPFVFAVWASKQTLQSEVVRQINSAFEYGVTHLKDSLTYSKPNIIAVDEAYTYLTRNIQYVMQEEHKKAIELYLSKVYPDIKSELNYI